MFDDTVVNFLRSGGCVLLERKCGVVGYRNYASSGKSSAIPRDSLWMTKVGLSHASEGAASTAEAS